MADIDVKILSQLTIIRDNIDKIEEAKDGLEAVFGVIKSTETINSATSELYHSCHRLDQLCETLINMWTEVVHGK